MFEMFFPKRHRNAPALPEPTPTLALGALLVRVAFADQTYRASEVAMIDLILARSFDLGPIEAAKLRATCEALERDAPGTDAFAALVRENVDYGERRAFARAMWQVVQADGRTKSSEVSALHQIEAALGISAADSSAVQQEALGKGAVTD